MDRSRCLYPEFIVWGIIFKRTYHYGRTLNTASVASPNEDAYSRSHLPFFYLYPTFRPAKGVQVLQKAWNLLSGDSKATLRSADSNLDALNNVDLGFKRLFSVGDARCGRGSPGRASLRKPQLWPAQSRFLLAAVKQLQWPRRS
jgi:hypothetical protein